jgi:hypothetical protein
LFPKQPPAAVGKESNGTTPTRSINEKLQTVRDKHKEPSKTMLTGQLPPQQNEVRRRNWSHAAVGYSPSEPVNSSPQQQQQQSRRSLLPNSFLDNQINRIKEANKRAAQPPSNATSATTTTTTTTTTQIVAQQPTPLSPPSRQSTNPRQQYRNQLFEKLRTRQQQIVNDPTYVCLDDEQLTALAGQIEESMFSECNDVRNPKSKYNKQLLAIKLALGISDNTTFYRKVLTGQVRAHELPNLDPSEMKDDKKREEDKTREALDIENRKAYAKSLADDQCKFLLKRGQRERIDECALEDFSHREHQTDIETTAAAATRTSIENNNDAGFNELYDDLPMMVETTTSTAQTSPGLHVVVRSKTVLQHVETTSTAIVNHLSPPSDVRRTSAEPPTTPTSQQSKPASNVAQVTPPLPTSLTSVRNLNGFIGKLSMDINRQNYDFVFAEFL